MEFKEDDISSGDDFDFEKQDAGSSNTHRVCVNDVNKKSVILMKGRPAKIVEKRVSKPGKHGVMKAVITGIDIFTEDKYVFTFIHEVNVVEVEHRELMLIDVDSYNNNYLTLLNDEGLEEEMELPKNEIGEKIVKEFEKSHTVTVVITKVLIIYIILYFM
jgi:translation elongation factor P/translation initiation factor 5A